MYVLLIVLSIALAGAVRPVAAQSFESAGVRAQGTGGAFVAIADDASATWWNPAGLAGGAYFNAILEFDHLEEPPERPDGGSRRIGLGAFSAAFPALGLSYYHFRVSEIRPSARAIGASLPSRQDQGPEGPGGVVLTSLAVNQFGVTVGQSIGDHLVVGSTLKLLTGTAADAVAPTASLDDADRLDGQRSFAATLDLGAMVTAGPAKAAIVVRNVTEPAFGDGESRITLPRQVRVGASATAEGSGRLSALTVAGDGDLTVTHGGGGDLRHVAVGVESWWWQRRIGARGGVSLNTVGTARVAPSIGASVALRSGVYADGALTRGTDESRRGWGLALRVTF